MRNYSTRVFGAAELIYGYHEGTYSLVEDRNEQSLF
jgi:hypothetical protein